MNICNINLLSKRFNKFFLLFLCLHLLNPLCAQITFNTDSVFQQARTLAFSGKRAEARELLRKILVLKPTYTDVQTLVGRSYAWDGKYDSARMELKQGLSYDNKNEDATNALIDVELWSDNYQAALDLSNKALNEINSGSEDFLLKKARAQGNLENYKDADTTLQALLKINPKNEKAISLAETVKWESRVNSIGINYDYDNFSSTFTPWHGVSAFYSRKTKYLGSVIARVNYAYRFDTSGIQYEVDMYPKLTKKMYSYFNAGYSNDGIFPSFRFGFSLYRSLPKSFEAEIGIRYLKFNDGIVIYTGSLSKYISNFWFSLRPYFIPDSQFGNSFSFSLISRFYFKGVDNYLNLTLGTGYGPDEFARSVTLLGKNNLTSKRASLGFQHRLLSRFLFKTNVGYRKDEFRDGLFRENYNFSIGLEMFF